MTCLLLFGHEVFSLNYINMLQFNTSIINLKLTRVKYPFSLKNKGSRMTGNFLDINMK